MGHRSVTRRDFIKRTGALAGGLAIPGILAACGRTPERVAPRSPSPTRLDTANIEGARIKVSTYGGFFEENFSKLYPDFTSETGAEVESVSQPTSEVWVTQLEQAIRSGTPTPADVSMLSGVGVNRAIKGDLLASYGRSDVPEARRMPENFVRTNEAGDVMAIGAVSWYITLVSNTKRVKTSPDTWTAFWDPAWRDELALLRNPGNSFLLEVTAALYFNGNDALQTRDGILEVMRKLAEVKPNVKLWYRDEAAAQQAFNTGEVSLGQFYHDITTYAASQGEPLRSVFPREGAILDSGFWSVTKTTENLAACVAFVNWMSRPEIQGKLARTLGTSPVVRREFVDLTEEEYRAVGGPGPEVALKPEYRIYDELEDWLDQRWSEIVLS